MRAVLVGLLFSLISTLSLGQSPVFYSDRALGVNPLQQTPTFLGYAQVRVCSIPMSSTSPCLPLATITDQFGNPASLNSGNFGQLTTDVVGRFSFGCTPGLYQVQVAATGSNTPQLNYPVTCPSGTSALLTTANAWLLPQKIGVAGSSTSRDTLQLLADAPRLYFGPGSAVGRINYKIANQDSVSGALEISYGTNVADPTLDTYSNLMLFTPSLITAFAPIFGTFSGSLNGAVNPQNFGAKCDGTTDDTAAFQAAINSAFPNNGGSSKALEIPATGQGCVVTQLNLTNINNEIRIHGQSSISGFQSIVWCRENTSNTKVCMDFTGSQYISIDHVDFYGGTSTADAPRATVLLAKSNTGNSQIIHWDDVTVEGYGDYQVYNYGGEVWKCVYCTFFQHGAAGVDLVRLTSTNSVGLTSPFATIGVGNESMTKVFLWGTWSAGGTSDALAIESSGFPVSQIEIGGFGNLTSASSFIRDLGAGEIHGLSLYNLRVEPACTNCKLLTISNNISNLKIDAQWAAASAPSVTLVSLSGQVNNSDIILRPGDGQPQFPSVAVITCSGTVLGTVIHDFVKTGGGPQTNACPAATEIFNSILLPELTQNGAKSFAGSCAMSAGTSCTITAITGVYAVTPFCFTSLDAASTPPATAIAAKCSLSGSTITITAGTSNSLTWDAMLVGNPN